MKIIIFLAVAALSVVEGQYGQRRNLVEEMKELCHIARGILSLDSVQTQLQGAGLQTALRISKEIGVGLGGGAGLVEWKKKRGTSYRKAVAAGGEFEMKFGSCNEDSHTSGVDASKTLIYKVLKTLIGGYSKGTISPEYPEDLFRIFGHAQASVYDPNLQTPTSCEDGQLKSVTARGELYPMGTVEGEGIEIADGVADACDPSVGTGVAKATGITGNGSINATGVGIAMAFGNAVDFAKEV